MKKEKKKKKTYPREVWPAIASFFSWISFSAQINHHSCKLTFKKKKNNTQLFKKKYIHKYTHKMYKVE